jgi:hypothetical protein
MISPFLQVLQIFATLDFDGTDCLSVFCISRGEKTRTSDPLHPMQVR